MCKKRRKALAVGVSLLLAVTSIGCSSQGVADDSLHLPKHEPTPKKQPPKLLSDEEFVTLVKRLNPELDDETFELIAAAIEKYSALYNVPENLIISVIAAESQFKPLCKGTLDDTGLMQIRYKYAPYWAKLMGINPPQNREELFNIDTNIQMGTYILKRLLNRYDGHLEKVLVAYNAGETYVDNKLRQDLSLPQKYVKKVSRYHVELCNIPLTAY
ncbi:MAG: lytic transglycosylase domain-containing protein [Clostridia bacterium]|nr:lytic transglycosylase domain-containing protein [Clostridia bacterium]